jgi:TPR repeat protein
MAQCSLGMMYRKGEGVPKDDAEAAKWFRKAADQGDANAHSTSGSCAPTEKACRRMMQRP